MKIAIVGTGYVGLVTGVGLSHIGHEVTCIDIDVTKIYKLSEGISPIYEPGLEDLMRSNLAEGRLKFTTDHAIAFRQADIIYIAVGTPENENGTANLDSIYHVISQISKHISDDVIVVTKSTVPVGTNQFIESRLKRKIPAGRKVAVVSNPEFLREGSAVYDLFHGDRMVLGSNDPEALRIMREVNEPFGIPIFETDVKSAEMIKYASNAFLATKISFVNEIANLCEKVEADIEEVSLGMGLDSRIGHQFLKAGIGYGGSCFPKDTKALKKIADHVDYEFGLLRSVIEFNNKQQLKLMHQAVEDHGSLQGKVVAVLGLSFKPGTDDVREAASLVILPELVKMGAEVKAYDPVAIPNMKSIMATGVTYVNNAIGAIKNADLVFILTEWDEIKAIPLEVFEENMSYPTIYDGRNCYSISEAEARNINYYSIGRRKVKAESSKERAKEGGSLNLCFAASSGGHLAQIMMLYPLMIQHNSVILTEKTTYEIDSKNIKTFYINQINRRELLFVFKFILLCIQTFIIFAKVRPDAVITTGALATIPMCIYAKIFKKKLIFIESFSKIHSPTVTGRFLYRFSDLFLVQWEEMKEHYPEATYGGGIY